MIKALCFPLIGILLTVSAAQAFSPEMVKSLNCAAYKAAKSEYSLDPMNGAATSVDGIAYPNTNRTLFRGAYTSNPQYDFYKVVRGIFKEKGWYIGSPMFFGITQVLTGTWDENHSFIPSGGLPLAMKEYFSVRGILADVRTLLNCRAPNFYNITEAEALAADLMNKVFRNTTTAVLDTRYFDMKQSNYYDAAGVGDYGFGNNAVDFIISTAYDQVAALYGIKTLVLKDSRHRALDLTFFNYNKNRSFYDSWVDAGEVNTPGYVTSEEVMGMQVRVQDRSASGWGTVLPNNPIDYAVYRYRYNGQMFGLVIDGNSNLCIIHGKDDRLFACDNYWSSLLDKQVNYPAARSDDKADVAPLIGIINQCDNSCPELAALTKWYGKSSRRDLDASVIDQINQMAVNGKALSYYREEAAKPPFQGIKVVSATYYDPNAKKKPTGNATQAAAAFANGKDSVEYKVSYYFLKMAKPTTDMEFEIQWKCSDDPSHVITKAIPAPAEGTKFMIVCPGGT